MLIRPTLLSGRNAAAGRKTLRDSELRTLRDINNAGGRESEDGGMMISDNDVGGGDTEPVWNPTQSNSLLSYGLTCKMLAGRQGV